MKIDMRTRLELTTAELNAVIEEYKRDLRRAEARIKELEDQLERAEDIIANLGVY